jgi:hypothetical protein
MGLTYSSEYTIQTKEIKTTSDKIIINGDGSVAIKELKFRFSADIKEKCFDILRGSKDYSDETSIYYYEGIIYRLVIRHIFSTDISTSESLDVFPYNATYWLSNKKI